MDKTVAIPESRGERQQHRYRQQINDVDEAKDAALVVNDSHDSTNVAGAVVV
jgi:hypothetical protein